MSDSILKISVLRALPGDEKSIAKRIGKPVSEVRRILKANEDWWRHDIVGKVWERTAHGEQYMEVNELEPVSDSKKKLPEKRKEASMVVNGGTLYEQVWDSDNGSRFVTIGEDGGTVYLDRVGDICPVKSNAIEEGAIMLPEKPDDYGSLDSLIKELKDFIHKYLDVSDDYETFSAYYIMLSWVYDKLNSVAYLRVLGDFGTGKSRFLDVVGRLLYKACVIAGSVTPAPIYRLLGKWKGSLVIDEADFSDSSEKNEIVTILNSGIERGRPVIRCDKDNPDDLKFFPCFGPKAVGGRRVYSDAAFESRCLREVMTETRRRDIPRVLPKKFFAQQAVLRNRLLKFRLDYYYKIDPDKENGLDFGNIEPRLEQIASCFIPLLANVPDVKDRFRGFIRGYSERMVIERAESYDGRMVSALVDMMIDGLRYISAGDIAKRINEGIADDSKKVNPVTVGRHLRALGFEFRVARIEDKTKRIITYDKERFLVIVERYVPQDSDNYEKIKDVIESVTSVTSVTDYLGVTDVTDVTDVTGSPPLHIGATNPKGTGLQVATINSYNIRKGSVTDGGYSPYTSVTSVTSVTDWKNKILSILSLVSELNYEELADRFYESLDEKQRQKFMENPNRFWDIIENLKKFGLIFEPNPGVFKKV